MRFAKWLACLLVLGAVLPLEARGQDQGFESLIEGVLKQHPDETQPEQPLPQPEQPLPQSEQAPPEQPLPQQPLPPSEPFPGVPSEPAAVAPPVLVPVEPGPRPYTPPKIAHPADENAPLRETGTASAPGATPAPAPSDTTAPATPAEATPGAAPLDRSKRHREHHGTRRGADAREPDRRGGERGGASCRAAGLQGRKPARP